MVVVGVYTAEDICLGKIHSCPNVMDNPDNLILTFTTAEIGRCRNLHQFISRDIADVITHVARPFSKMTLQKKYKKSTSATFISEPMVIYRSWRTCPNYIPSAGHSVTPTDHHGHSCRERFFRSSSQVNMVKLWRIFLPKAISLWKVMIVADRLLVVNIINRTTHELMYPCLHKAIWER